MQTLSSLSHFTKQRFNHKSFCLFSVFHQSKLTIWNLFFFFGGGGQLTKLKSNIYKVKCKANASANYKLLRKHLDFVVNSLKLASALLWHFRFAFATLSAKPTLFKWSFLENSTSRIIRFYRRITSTSQAGYIGSCALTAGRKITERGVNMFRHTKPLIFSTFGSYCCSDIAAQIMRRPSPRKTNSSRQARSFFFSIWD